MRYTDFQPEIEQGDALLAAGRAQEALALCDQVLAQMPDHAGALFLAGGCHFELNRLDLAEAAFREALGHLEGNAAILTQLAAVLDAQDRHADALAACDRAIHADRSHAPAFIFRGQIRMFHRVDPGGALEDLNRALELDADAADAWFLRGLCHLGLQRMEEARHDFDRALSRNPNLQEQIDAALETYGNALQETDE